MLQFFFTWFLNFLFQRYGKFWSISQDTFVSSIGVISIVESACNSSRIWMLLGTHKQSAKNCKYNSYGFYWIGQKLWKCLLSDNWHSFDVQKILLIDSLMMVLPHIFDSLCSTKGSNHYLQCCLLKNLVLDPLVKA